MANIKEILERTNLDNMISYLLDEPEPGNGKIEVSDKAIEDSYREFIAKDEAAVRVLSEQMPAMIKKHQRQLSETVYKDIKYPLSGK